MPVGGSIRDQPLVSAITIFLNAESFLEEAIESVFAQTYGRWEYILVDDGSTDHSTAIARRYSGRHADKVRYLEHEHHQNRGMSASRNLGIRHAHGEYIAFLDADDVWLPCKLEHQVALIEAHPEAGMLCGASQYWYGWTGRPADARRDRIVPVGAPQDTLFRPPALLTTLHPLGSGVAPCVSSLLIRRWLLDAVGGFEECFRGALQLYEDQAFLTKVYLKAPVLITRLCCDRYRQHAASCVSTVTKSGRYHEVRRTFLTWLEHRLAAQGETDAHVARVLESALMRYRRPARFFLGMLWHDPAAALKWLAGETARRLLSATMYGKLRTLRQWLSTIAPTVGGSRLDGR